MPDVRVEEIHTGDVVRPEGGPQRLVIGKSVDVDGLIWLSWTTDRKVSVEVFRPEDMIDRAIEGPVTRHLRELKTDA